jgi:glutamate dehydrogenase
LGIAFTIQEACKTIGLNMQKSTVAVHGFGNVGKWSALSCKDMGATIVAVAEYDGVLYDPEGLDLEALSCHFEEKRSFADYSKAKLITLEEFWKLPVDIMIPCALENSITADVAKMIKAQIVAEGANGPVTEEADSILYNNGILVIPDILCNAGGVTVSYFEWVQNLSGNYWPEETIVEAEERTMVCAFESIHVISMEYKVPMRLAAYMHSVKKIAEAMKLRGWY